MRICWARSDGVELHFISSRFSMPTPCSPVRQPPSVDAELQDLVAANLGALLLVRIVGVVEDQRVQIAVAGVENIGDAEPQLAADRRRCRRSALGSAERDHPVHAHIVGDAADRAERRLAALPDRGALPRSG